ncbi:MAG: DUF1415 domain-containing protein [Chitinophagaceae bacterium]|nr:DUF1415 domain-containing protein [Chitinophagaceae bacterium]
MSPNEIIIAQTKKWIRDVIVGCHFCPFAARELKAGTIHYEVTLQAGMQTALESLASSFNKLDADETIETIFIIFPDTFKAFDEYLNLLEVSESLLKRQDYEGIYQIASFHPDYLFAGSAESDPANYTNRSPYPMLHLLREETVSRAIDGFPGTEKIPQSNIKYARQKGLLYMKSLRDSCFWDDILE